MPVFPSACSNAGAYYDTAGSSFSNGSCVALFVSGCYWEPVINCENPTLRCGVPACDKTEELLRSNQIFPGMCAVFGCEPIPQS